MSLFNMKPSAISDLKNPFSEDMIEVVHFHCYKRPLFGGPPTFSAIIKFQNGDTTGEQRVEAENFAALVQKVDAFIKGLSK